MANIIAFGDVNFIMNQVVSQNPNSTGISTNNTTDTSGINNSDN